MCLKKIQNLWSVKVWQLRPQINACQSWYHVRDDYSEKLFLFTVFNRCFPHKKICFFFVSSKSSFKKLTVLIQRENRKKGISFWVSPFGKPGNAKLMKFPGSFPWEPGHGDCRLSPVQIVQLLIAIFTLCPARHLLFLHTAPTQVKGHRKKIVFPCVSASQLFSIESFIFPVHPMTFLSIWPVLIDCF